MIIITTLVERFNVTNNFKRNGGLMKQEDFIYKPKIDSGKLSIPLSQVEVKLDSIKDMLLVTYTSTESGEVLEELEQRGKPYQVDNKEDGTYIRVWIEPQINYRDGKAVSEMYLSVLINSKHLGKDYFKGITKETLKCLYERIMSWNLFYCEFKDFQTARFNDVDICFDFQCSPEHFTILKKNIKMSVKDESKFHSKSSKSNTGLYAPTFRDPRKQATPSNPYIKFYDKDLDLKVRSQKFGKKYLNDIDTSNLFRYECTIQSKKHLKRLGLVEVRTFWELLECDLHIICSQMFREYFHKPKIIKEGNIRPMDKVIIDFINICIEQGVPRYEIFKVFDRDDVSRQSKSDLIKKYHTIMKRDEIKKEELQSNELTKNLFKYLGVDVEQLKIDFDKPKEEKKKRGNT